MEYDVVSFEFLGGYRLRVQFADGVAGILDLTPRLARGPVGDVFDAIAAADVFQQVQIVHGVLTWPGEIDLAPDAMHDEIAATGQSVLRAYAEAMP